MTTTKETVRSLLNQLPEQCSFEDIQYHLYVLAKVQQGLAMADREGTIAQAKAEKRLSQWLQ
ncbi:MAG: hypothetical protein AAGG51_10890 [Cyanobacteria bacterium P01_G01_bin.54]